MNTPIGTFEFHTSGKFISMSSNVVVRGVEYRVSLGANLIGDDWVLSKERDNIYIRRPDKRFNHDGPSDSARAVIMKTAQDAVREWAKANQEIIKQANRDALVRDCQSSAETITELKKKLQEATRAWESAKDKLYEFDKAWEYGDDCRMPTAEELGNLPNA